MPERRPRARPKRVINEFRDDIDEIDELLARRFSRELVEIREANLMNRLAEARVDRRSRKPGKGFG